MYPVIDSVFHPSSHSRLHQLAFLRGCAKQWSNYCRGSLPTELPEALGIVEHLESMILESAYDGLPENINEACAIGMHWGLKDAAWGQYANAAQFMRGCEALLREFRLMLKESYDGEELEYLPL